jgi:hypothetical protein
MTGASSRWTCDRCNATVAMTHKGHHRKFKCPEQGNLLRAKKRQEQAIANEAAREAERLKAIEEAKPPPPKFFQYLACVCGCGAQIGQVKGQRKRQFVDASHYEKWRRAALRAAGGGDAELAEERKRSEEVAAVAAKDDAIRREAEAVRMVTGEATLRLWAQCLGFRVDGVPVSA